MNIVGVASIKGMPISYNCFTHVARPTETMLYVLLVIASVILRTFGFTWCLELSLLLLAELSPWIAIVGGGLAASRQVGWLLVAYRAFCKSLKHVSRYLSLWVHYKMPLALLTLPGSPSMW